MNTIAAPPQFENKIVTRTDLAERVA